MRGCYLSRARSPNAVLSVAMVSLLMADNSASEDGKIGQEHQGLVAWALANARPTAAL